MIRHTTFAIRVLLGFYLLAVAYLCFGHFDSMSSVSPSFLGIPTDKIVHFMLFFPFPFLVYGAADRHNRRPWRSFWFVFVTFLAGCVIAMGTEIGQYFTRYRSADPKDFLADGIALLVSSIIVLCIDLYKQK
ncbi:MAG: VanZ family protein [Bacteroidales bacterium]|nr:VanZ family protein [Bacteroidales bacterium]MEE3406456.1 VanZ family protein [Candidatus Cryptobacteroides sp.]SKC39732.1 VanZ like family protein [Bacteroidales bacterium WCE2008]MBO7366152.1 VanZ family protein [Bacteroidales bacterium]MBO7623516.1 VanZ family protein [Bacteroidales bacterium]